MNNYFYVNTFRQNFPFFAKEEIVYLDSAATTLKPQVLIDATVAFYQSAGSVHRSQYDAVQTAQYETARLKIAQYFNADSSYHVIWTSGTTHAINLVANGLLPTLAAQDEIVVSQAEHHANFVSWQQTAQKCGAKFNVIPFDEKGIITPDNLLSFLHRKIKVVALQLVSNVTGIRQPVEQLIPLIRQHSPNAFILLDIAQAVLSESVDVKRIDADFYCFSAHKMYGPTGLGVLLGKEKALQSLQPLFFGGKMVTEVQVTASQFANLPYRLEGGTPNIAAVVGFLAVIEWLQQQDVLAMQLHTKRLAMQVRDRLNTYPDCQLYSGEEASIVSFVFAGINNTDLAILLAEQKIALRQGEHCAKPYMQQLDISGTLRLSLAPYNTEQEITHFFQALDSALQLLRE